MIPMLLSWEEFRPSQFQNRSYLCLLNWEKENGVLNHLNLVRSIQERKPWVATVLILEKKYRFFNLVMEAPSFDPPIYVTPNLNRS